MQSAQSVVEQWKLKLPTVEIHQILIYKISQIHQIRQILINQFQQAQIRRIAKIQWTDKIHLPVEKLAILLPPPGPFTVIIHTENHLPLIIIHSQVEEEYRNTNSLKLARQKQIQWLETNMEWARIFHWDGLELECGGKNLVWA